MVSEATRKSMQGNKSANTKPELLVRKELRARGLPGYRLQWKKVPGHPDIAYPGRRIAIFVNGCFWHHHEGCRYATMPSTNVEYWKEKFERNVARDERTRAQLEEMGWKVIVIWECELKKDRLKETIDYVVMEIEEASAKGKPDERDGGDAAHSEVGHGIEAGTGAGDGDEAGIGASDGGDGDNGDVTSGSEDPDAASPSPEVPTP